jgi:uncharacterized protein YycO
MRNVRFFIFTLGVFLFSIASLFGPNVEKAAAAFSLKTGDIVITSDSVSAGIVGHAGIVLSDGYILHIPGPFAGGMKKDSWSSWKSKYSTNEVLRQPNTTVAGMAATWAKSHYWTTNRTPFYAITTNLASTSTTYCSKIVWQAYYYGTGSYPVMTVPSEFIAPYYLKSRFTSTYKPTHVYGAYLSK